MSGKLIYFVILDLIILTYAKPGGYYHKSDHGNPHWGPDDWYHGWHHDWHDHTTQRAKTKGTTAKIAGSSITTPPQPSIRDIEIRIGEETITTKQTTLRPFVPEKTTPNFRPFVSEIKHSPSFKPSVPETQPPVKEGLTSEKTEPEQQIFQIAEFISGPEDDKTDLNHDTITGSNSTVDSAVAVDNGSGDKEENISEVLGGSESEQTPNKWHVMVYESKPSREDTNKVIHTYLCGGTLVKADLVISAGHCFQSKIRDPRPTIDFRVAAGKLFLDWEDPRDKNAQYNIIARYSTSPLVQPCLYTNLAYLTMSEPFTLNDFVKPACVSFEYGIRLRKGNLGTVATSAVLEDGNCKPSEQINWLSLPYVEEKDCSLNETVGISLTERICAGDVNNVTHCETDSGNGLIFFQKETPYLRGVVSFIPTHYICVKWTTRSFTNLEAVEFKSEGEIREIFNSLDSKECEALYRNTSIGTDPFDSQGGNDTEFFTIQGIGSDPVPTLEGTSAPSFQWHVGVYSKKWSPFMQICGGSLVKRDFVISAAHCFWDDTDEQLPETQFAVAGGKLYRPWNEPRDTYAQQSDVAELILPVRFRGSATSFQDDIAILRLATPFTYAPGVQSVCLDFDVDFDREQLQSGNTGTVAGWGLTQENGVPSQRLNFLKLPYVDLDICFAVSNPSFYKYITSDKICAGTQSGKALCRGDSGGGIVFFTPSNTPYLRGIASTAANNENLCNAYVLAAFTHIYAHRTFIKEFIPDIEKECAGIRNDTNKNKDGNLAGNFVGSIGTENLGTVTGIGTENVGTGTPVGSTSRNVMPAVDTTPSYASVPYNHFVCNCNCKP